MRAPWCSWAPFSAVDGGVRHGRAIPGPLLRGGGSAGSSPPFVGRAAIGGLALGCDSSRDGAKQVLRGGGGRLLSHLAFPFPRPDASWLLSP